MYRVLALWIALAGAGLTVAVAQRLAFESPPVVGLVLAVALPWLAMPLAWRLAGGRRRRHGAPERRETRLLIA